MDEVILARDALNSWGREQHLINEMEMLAFLDITKIPYNNMKCRDRFEITVVRRNFGIWCVKMLVNDFKCTFLKEGAYVNKNILNL